MKFENATKASELVKQIEKQIRLLDELSSENVVVSIHDGPYKITTIGYASDEHSLGLFATEFVKNCREYVSNKIESLKAELEPL